MLQFKSEIKNLKPDLGLCVAFGPPYFDQEMIDIPKFKIINIHPSPLPKYRGATPGPWQIINGETIINEIKSCNVKFIRD